MNDEITRCIEAAHHAIDHTDDNDLETRITDTIANLVMLAYEEKLNIGDVLTNAVGHFAATYIDGANQLDAGTWLEYELFPLTGVHQFAFYAAQRACQLAGQPLSTVPEWGV